MIHWKGLARTALWVLITILMVSQKANAHQLRGVVTSGDGTPLGAISVYVKGTSYGVVTNLKGVYTLELGNGDYQIIFRHLGFQDKLVRVRIQGENKELNVVLQEDVQQLEALTITDDEDDKAYAIIKSAQEKRKDYLAQFEKAKCETYSKLTLEKESEIQKIDTTSEIHGFTEELSKEQMELIETHSFVYFKSPNTVKEIKHAYLDHSKVGRRLNFGQTRDLSLQFNGPEDKYSTPSGEGFEGQFLFYKNIGDADFNFYQNRLALPSLNETSFISPIGGPALSHYRYKWKESFIEDGLLVHKIEVMPKRSTGAVFEGHIYIVDGLWNIKATELSIRENALTIYDEFKVFQNYVNLEDKWVLLREEFFYNTKSRREYKLGRSQVIYSDWEFEPEVPKKFFDNQVASTALGADEKGAEFWASNRPITMNSEEALFIKKQDSVRTYLSSPEYLRQADSSYNHTGIWDFVLYGVGKRNSAKGYRFEFDPLIMQPRPFSVGGYRHALGGLYEKTFEDETRLDLRSQLDYGFLNKDLRGRVRVGYRYDPIKMARFWVSAGSEYEILNSFESIVATFSRSNYLLSNHITVGHEIEIVNGIFLDLSLRYSHQKPIDDIRLSQWSNWVWAGANLNTPEYFDPYSKLMFDNKISIRFKQKYEIKGKRKIIRNSPYPKLNIRHKWGIPKVLGSDIAFHYLHVKLWDDFKMGGFGYSKYNIETGSFLFAKDTRFVDNQFFRGSDPIFLSNPLLSFQLLGRSVNTQGPYFQANYVHHFNGALLNRVPLIRRTRLKTVLGAATLLDSGTDIIHTEAFAGIEWPFRLGTQLLKVGVYGVQSYGNYNKGDQTLKVGIDFFNSYSGRWNY